MTADRACTETETCQCCTAYPDAHHTRQPCSRCGHTRQQAINDRTQQIYTAVCKQRVAVLGRALTLDEADLLMEAACDQAETEARAADTRDAAVAALTAAARTEHDFADYLADVLARVAANLGSVEALTAGRSGSWEAALLDRLVSGTVVDGDLTPYRTTAGQS